MLKWMQEELKKSELKGQFVYIIGHIPPNNNMNTWALRYNAIIDRFSYTIRGQFYGHTHNDHIGAHYSIHNQSSLVNYYFVAPSLTTYDFRVPRYRILDIDFDTLQTKDFHQYRLDIRKYQKKEDKAKFELLYSFK
jgi:sphingomyelin phosphodiesterase